MNTLKENNQFVSSQDLSNLVNEQMARDSFYHPNLGGVTRGGMSNHYPMTVMALAGLGASDSEIMQFGLTGQRYRAHVKQDLALVDNNEITLDNWGDFLGKTEKLLEFSRVFEEGIRLKGTAVFVTECLSKMMLSLPMGLFHPLIKLTFAVNHGDINLIANALAYYAIRYYNLYQKYPQLKQQNEATNESTNAVSNSALSVWKNISQSIDKMALSSQTSGGSLRVCEQLCSDETLQQLSFSNQFMINQENLPDKIIEISQAAIRLYAYQPSLTTLHAVTSCQALADLTIRFCDNQQHNQSVSLQQKEVFVNLWTLYWAWLTGLYVEKGAPEKLPLLDSNDRGDFFDLFNEFAWDVIAEKARKIPESHLIKMVYSCKWLYENIEKNDLYQLVCMNILVEKKAHPSQIRWTKLSELV